MLNEINFNCNYQEGQGTTMVYNPLMSNLTLQLKFIDTIDLFKEGEIKNFKDILANEILSKYPFFVRPEEDKYTPRNIIQLPPKEEISTKEDPIVLIEEKFEEKYDIINFKYTFENSYGKIKIYNPELSGTDIKLVFTNGIIFLKQGELKEFSQEVVSRILKDFPYFLNSEDGYYSPLQFKQIEPLFESINFESIYEEGSVQIYNPDLFNKDIKLNFINKSFLFKCGEIISFKEDVAHKILGYYSFFRKTNEEKYQPKKQNIIIMQKKLDFPFKRSESIGEIEIYNPFVSEISLQLNFNDGSEFFREGETKKYSQKTIDIIMEEYPYFINPNELKYKPFNFNLEQYDTGSTPTSPICNREPTKDGGIIRKFFRQLKGH